MLDLDALGDYIPDGATVEWRLIDGASIDGINPGDNYSGEYFGEVTLGADMYPSDFSAVRHIEDVQSDDFVVAATDGSSVVYDYKWFNYSDFMFNSDKYTESELDAMTKEQILTLAEKLMLALSTTSSNTKAEIIADFLAMQG